ncbi:IS66 family insertion sequence element accessory protein TnpB [Nitrobacter sp. TKz-YC02]|uniref:IS66 family insertion sequence element accessory protein TnpB n=1 Tax=Nitrobacter sp. TKz-YC02 TaxID=3398704 RepID=UPI003CE85FD7
MTALLPPNVKVHLALGYIDMRKGIDGLAMLVQGVLHQDPFTGHLFVFRGRTRANLIKIIYWDGTGFCLFTKRLEHGVFLWPPSIAPGETLSLTSAHGAAQNRVDPSFLGHGPALGRCHLSAVSRQQLAQRRFLGSARVSDPATPVSFRFEIAGPALGVSPLVERFSSGRNATTAHLRLPSTSEFAYRRHREALGSPLFSRYKDAGDAVPRVIPQRPRDIWLCRSCACFQPHPKRGVEKTYRIKDVRVCSTDGEIRLRCRAEATLCQFIQRAAHSL